MIDGARFRAPHILMSGAGSVEALPTVIRSLALRSIVVVTDERLMALGVTLPCTDLLDAHGVTYQMYGGATSEPTLRHVDAVVRLLVEAGADGVIGLGGGSAIDTAKAASVMSTNPGSLSDYQGYDRLTRPGLPLIAIPTTAGTGSEVTRVTVVTDEDRHVKMMLASDHLIATAAIVDAHLTMACPPPVTASSGVDALTHAIEAYVSRRAQPITDALARSACRLVASWLPRAYRDGGDAKARAHMMDGQLMAGLAFSNASVALIHGMSRPLGALFSVPHGLANAMLLAVVSRFSLPGAAGRYADIALDLGVEPGAGESSESIAARGVDALSTFVAALDIPTIGRSGVARDAFEASLDKMAGDALESGSPANNPVVPSHDEIVRLYLESY